MTRFKRLGALALAGCLTPTLPFAGLAGETSSAGRDLERDLTRWVGHLASDELGGRETFSDGLVRASEYLAGELEAASVLPAGDGGSYFQTVAVNEVRATNRSTITVEAGGMRRTFEHGAEVTVPDDVGPERTFTSRDLVFAGYGLYAPHLGHDDYAGKSVAGKVVVWLGGVPSAHDAGAYGGSTATRALYATEQKRAAASIGGGASNSRASCAAHASPTSCSASAQKSPSSASSAHSCGASAKSCPLPGSKSCGMHGHARGGSGGATFFTASRLDLAVAPQVTAGDELLEFLFSGASVPYREVKRKADAGDPLPAVTFRDVSISFALDVRYEIVGRKRSRNVVAVVGGSDPRLKNTYIAFGAHYDHLGAAPDVAASASGHASSSPSCPQAPAASGGDTVFNGADDNASGTAALLALAKAYARGSRPLRSVLFVWHTGEERGLWGSRFFADHPTVPLEAIVAHVNLDMVGRNHHDRAENADTLLLVGSDWISSEVHATAVEANAALRRPFALDFSMNSPSDPGLAYYRSDHYSYAAKGIPSVFITTGPHADYHALSDTADKIDYGKLARVVEYASELGSRLANMTRAPERDFAGARAGVRSQVRGTGPTEAPGCVQ
jgi:hypothetical protein